MTLQIYYDCMKIFLIFFRHPIHKSALSKDTYSMSFNENEECAICFLLKDGENDKCMLFFFNLRVSTLLQTCLLSRMHTKLGSMCNLQSPFFIQFINTYLFFSFSIKFDKHVFQIVIFTTHHQPCFSHIYV